MKIPTVCVLCFLLPTSALASDYFQGGKGVSLPQEKEANLSVRPSVPSELHFGLTPYLPGDLLIRELRPLMEYLSRNLGIPVKLIIAPNYEGLGARLEKAQIDIASFSPLAYVLEKRKNATLRLLLGQIVGGTTSYTAYIIVRAEGKIRQLDQLKGKVFAFVDRNSTSGYLFPYAFFLNHNIDPEKYFKEVLFAGNHLKAIQYVLEGKADASATYSEGLMAGRESGLNVRSLRIIKKTGRIPSDAVCARGDLDPALVQRLKTLLLGLDTRNEQGRAILGETLRINGWIEVTDEQYETTRQYLEQVETHAKEEVPTGIE